MFPFSYNFFNSRRAVIAAFTGGLLCARHHSMNFTCITSFNPSTALWSRYIIKPFLQIRKWGYRKAKQLVLSHTVSKLWSQERPWTEATELSHLPESSGLWQRWGRLRFLKLPTGQQHSTGVRKTSRGQSAGHWIQLGHPLAVWPRASYLTSLYLRLLICRMGIITVPTSEGCGEYQTRQYLWSS